MHDRIAGVRFALHKMIGTKSLILRRESCCNVQGRFDVGKRSDAEKWIRRGAHFREDATTADQTERNLRERARRADEALRHVSSVRGHFRVAKLIVSNSRLDALGHHLDQIARAKSREERNEKKVPRRSNLVSLSIAALCDWSASILIRASGSGLLSHNRFSLGRGGCRALS
jgi:hypothetical protein